MHWNICVHDVFPVMQLRQKKMAPKNKLTYFNGRGFGEVTRILFACNCQS